MRDEAYLRKQRIIHLLLTNHYGVTYEEVRHHLHQDGFEVSTRTLYRDFKALQTHLPLLQDTDKATRQTRWRIDPEMKRVPGVFTDLEWLALWCNGRFFLQQAVFPTTTRQALAKIEERLSPETIQRINRLSEQLLTHPRVTHTSLEHPSPFLPELIDAMTQNRCVQIRYFNTRQNETKIHKVAPVRLCTFNDSLYLWAYSYRREAPRTFSLANIDQFQPLDEKSDAEIRAQVNQFYAYAFGMLGSADPVRLSIKFDATVATHIRCRNWSRLDPEFQDHNDGSMTLTVTVAVPEELCNWLRKYDGYAEVLEPLSVREAFIARIRQSAERYQLL
ncbi:MAG: WYL domain-containing protein [Gemmatimonadetes bacterium]|nr:MAG: WYL domain-containing protein [Gemmatimonadota bacterium]